METDLHRLGISLGFAFGFPIIVYATGMAWNKISGAPRKVKKVWATFCLALPIAALAMLVHPSVLARLWATSPSVLLLLGFVFGGCAPAVLITAIARLWRTRTPDSRRRGTL
jgi:biotin transporter BioY